MFDIRDHGGSYGGTGKLSKATVMDGLNIIELPSPIAMGNSVRALKAWDDKLYTADAYDYIRYWGLNKVTKQWSNYANYYVYPRDITGYSSVTPLVTVFSRNNEYLYVMARCSNSSGKVVFYTLQINLSNSVVKQIGVNNQLTSAIPWVVYADDTYFYYVMNGRIYKAKASDLSEVTSNAGGVNWNTDLGDNQHQYYCAANNTVYNIGNGYQLVNSFTGINLTTLTATVYSIPNDYRNSGEGGFWCDGTYFYTIGTGVSGSPYSYNFIKVQIGSTAAVVNYSNTSQLQNPSGFKKGLTFKSVLFYDPKTQLLWVRTTDLIGSYSYESSIILLGIDLSTFTIKDSLWLGSVNGNNGSLYGPGFYYNSGIMNNAENNRMPIWYQPSTNIFKQFIQKQ